MPNPPKSDSHLRATQILIEKTAVALASGHSPADSDQQNELLRALLNANPEAKKLAIKDLTLHHSTVHSDAADLITEIADEDNRTGPGYTVAEITVTANETTLATGSSIDPVFEAKKLPALVEANLPAAKEALYNLQAELAANPTLIRYNAQTFAPYDTAKAIATLTQTIASVESPSTPIVPTSTLARADRLGK